MMEQVEELIVTEDYAEAILNLERLFDQGADRIVEVGRVQQASGLKVRRYISLRDWTQNRLSRLLRAHADSRHQYNRKVAEVSRAAWTEALQSKDLAFVRQTADRFRATPFGPKLNLLWSDLCLERGWSLAAIEAAQRACGDLRAPLDADEVHSDTLGWPLIWHKLSRGVDHDTYSVALYRRLTEATGEHGQDRVESLLQSMRRVVMAASIDPDAVDRSAILAWAELVSRVIDQEDRLSEQQKQQWQQLLEQARAWSAPPPDESHWETFAGNNARDPDSTASYHPTRRPTWSQALERYTATNDRTAASRPRVGETERGLLPYHPVVAEGKVFIHELTRIVAYDLQTGRPWPDIQPPLPLFDSRIAAAAFIPRGYPLVGSPRASLAYQDHCLYARMGGPVTGWANQEGAADGGSLSYLVGLDVRRQGSLLRGFPIRLQPPDFAGGEFEGAPLVWGDRLLVAIVDRDNVGLRRSVAAFNRFSGQLIWKSAAVAAGTVKGSDRANLISHQLLSTAGGRVFYNTNLGTIACLDPLTGATQWLTCYNRVDSAHSVYPQPDRFRYRDLTPCLVSGGLVYCAPQDCPEIFALDATTGDLVWSTDKAQVADTNQLLGVHGDCLIASGDRLVWMNRLTGQVLAAFPGATTPGVVHALPSPRGLGRGVVSGGHVYWPSAGEIFVFPAEIAEVDRRAGAYPLVPPIEERIPLGIRGQEGGNLAAVGRWLLYTGPSRILAFEEPLDSDLDTISWSPAQPSWLPAQPSSAAR